MNPVKQHPIVTLCVIIFSAVTALVVFRLNSGARTDSKQTRVITVGTVTPLPATATSSRHKPSPPCGKSSEIVQSWRNFAR